MDVKYGYDILNETRGILVHSANAMGVMGAGLALKIKLKYPEVYKDYKYLLKETRKTGSLGLCVFTYVAPELVIVTGIGQYNYGRDPCTVYTDYNAIEKIFKKVNFLALERNLPVIFPRIGAGLGGGKWETIERIIENTLSVEVEKTLYIL